MKKGTLTKKKLQVLIKETLFNSLSKAIIKLLETPYLVLKLFVFSFILATSGVTSYACIQSILSYFNYEVITTIRSIHEMPTLYPKITFCNVNSLTSKYVFDIMDKYNFNNYNFIYSFANLTIEEKKSLGHHLDDILLSCEFNSQPCNTSDFSCSFDINYGNCFTFNTNIDMKKQTIWLAQVLA